MRKRCSICDRQFAEGNPTNAREARRSDIPGVCIGCTRAPIVRIQLTK